MPRPSHEPCCSSLRSSRASSIRFGFTETTGFNHSRWPSFNASEEKIFVCLNIGADFVWFKLFVVKIIQCMRKIINQMQRGISFIWSDVFNLLDSLWRAHVACSRKINFYLRMGSTYRNFPLNFSILEIFLYGGFNKNIWKRKKKKLNVHVL